MCADSGLKLLKYPKLTPLYQAQFLPNNNCKVGPFTITKGFSYQVAEKSELEQFNYPIGFNSEVDELKAICFSVNNKLKQSVWRISEIKQHSYQELYTFEHKLGMKIRCRFTYDRNITVKTLVFLDETTEQGLIEELKALLYTTVSLSEPRLDKALQTLKEFLQSTDYKLIEAKKRSDWEFLIGISDDIEAIELKVYVGKDGLISKIMPEKASTEDIVKYFREALNES
jgi:hypothetical protein